MVEQYPVEQDPAERELVEHCFAAPRLRPGCGAAPECIACAARTRPPCAMRRVATPADGSTSDLSAVAGVSRRGPVAIIDNTIIENASAG
jgi:hypothetical protein